MGHSAEAFDETAKASLNFKLRMAEMDEEEAKAGLTRHAAEVELGLGQVIDLRLTGKITSLEIDPWNDGRVLIRVQIMDENGAFLSGVTVTREMIVR